MGLSHPLHPTHRSKFEVCRTHCGERPFSLSMVMPPPHTTTNDGHSSPARRVSGIINCRLHPQVVKSSSLLRSISDTPVSLILLIAGGKAANTYRFSHCSRAIVTSLGSCSSCPGVGSLYSESYSTVQQSRGSTHHEVSCHHLLVVRFIHPTS
jgi:hypothetical protein